MSGSRTSSTSGAGKPLRILVTGLTGQQGGHVAQQLLQRGHRVRAVVRNPQGPKAQAFGSRGVELVEGSFDDPSTMEGAGRGVDAMFLMGTPAQGPEVEARQGKAAVDAAQRARVPWLVYSSVCDADRSTGIPHFESKFSVEQHLGRSTVAHAISAPTAFMENLLAPYQLPTLRQGKNASGTTPDRKVQMVALDDLAAFVVQMLENPSQFSGKRINVASDAVSGAEVARALAGATRRTIEYQQIPLEAVRKQNPDYAKMFEFLERTGYSADIEGLRREYPAVGWHRFGEWAAGQDWPRLLG
jgi:uncharacterized protein YbjT (DUF2867 family)